MVFSVFVIKTGENRWDLQARLFRFARRKFQKSQGLISPAEDLREEIVSLIYGDEQSLGGFFSLEFWPPVCFALHAFS